MLKKYSKIITYFFITLVMFVYIFPLAFLLNTSLKSDSDFMSNPVGLVRNLHFENFLQAWEMGNFSAYFLNSIIYTASITILTIILAVLSAYPISRGYLKHRNLWYIFFIMQLFLPGGMIPLFKLAVLLGLYDTPYGYILISINIGTAFMFFVGFIKSIPKEFDEAAAIDGIGYFRHVLTNIIPMMKPAISSVAILTSIACWNNVVTPSIYLSNQKYWPIVLGLLNFRDSYIQNWTLLAAAIMIVALPLILLYIFMQRFFIDGLATGAVKA